ncbi:MAG: DUF3801 domain-containing protein [Lachnospiraceae bacterium]|nr:DUF3801 domain-containing protein [Lachnospiraceae bacterium]
MSGITDDIHAKEADIAKKIGKKAFEAAIKLFKGIALKLKSGEELTQENIIKSVKEMLNKVDSGVDFSVHNVDIKDLIKDGNVTAVPDQLTKEQMKYFDKYCKQYGIHYAALKNGTGKDATYTLFFKSGNADLIFEALKRGVADYEKDQQKKQEKTNAKEQKKTSREQKKQEKEQKKAMKQARKQKTKEKAASKAEERESVRAKLAFFRDRVERNEKMKQPAKEKLKNKNEMAR